MPTLPSHRDTRSTRILPAVLVALIALAATGARAHAQVVTTADSASRRELAAAPWRIGFSLGAAHGSPVGWLGKTPGQDHRFVGLDAETTMLRLGVVRLNYAFQVLPYVALEGTVPVMDQIYDGIGPAPQTTMTTVRTRAYGISPFGVELATPATARVSVFASAAAGGLVFDRPYPIPQAERLNFTLEYGGGALLRIGHAHWIRAGYKYHHLSNAYLARANPGVDGNVYYAGYQWAVVLPR